MSFHKRFLSKSIILSNISNLDRLFNADALIKDMWSARFCDDLDKEQRELRNLILEKYESQLKFSSFIKIEDIPEFQKLNSLAECLVSLMTNPHWVDIFLVKTKLGLSQDINGDFNKGVELCIERILEHYDRPNRNDKIEEILK